MRSSLIFAFTFVFFVLFSTLHAQYDNGASSRNVWGPNTNGFNSGNGSNSNTNGSNGTRNPNTNGENDTRSPNPVGANGNGRVSSTNGANGNGRGSSTNGANGNVRGFKEYIKNKNFNDNITIPLNWWDYFSSNLIPHWKISTDKFEIGYGKVYNSKWEENITVTELEVEKNEQISQEFVVTSEQNCVFSFRYSAKDNVFSSFLSSGQSTSGLFVKVNGIELLRIEHLKDSDVHTFTKDIKSIRGINKVEVTDIAYSNSHGTVVTDFSFKCPI